MPDYESTFQGTEVKIFQDLLNITLQRRRELRPLLDLLCSRAITYRGKFPFCLLATAQGCTALLKVPEDLDHFCSTLDIPFIELPNDFRLPTLRGPHQWMVTTLALGTTAPTLCPPHLQQPWGHQGTEALLPHQPIGKPATLLKIGSTCLCPFNPVLNVINIFVFSKAVANFP